MNIIGFIIGTGIMFVFAIIIISLFVVFYPKYEKGIRVIGVKPGNSDCDISYTIENLELLGEETKVNARLGKLR